MSSPGDYYNAILEQRRLEYSSRGLGKIPSDFYTMSDAFLKELRALLDQQAREDPTGRRVEVTRQTYQRALQQTRDVIDARMSKIATRAAQYASMGGEVPAMLPVERLLFDALVNELLRHRGNVAPFLSGGAPAPPSPAVPSGGSPASQVAREGGPPQLSGPAMEANPAGGSRPSGGVTKVKEEQPEGWVIRILQDGPPFEVSPGDTLELLREDVVTLPPSVAQILVHAGRAVRIQPGDRVQVT